MPHWGRPKPVLSRSATLTAPSPSRGEAEAARPLRSPSVPGTQLRMNRPPIKFFPSSRTVCRGIAPATYGLVAARHCLVKRLHQELLSFPGNFGLLIL